MRPAAEGSAPGSLADWQASFAARLRASQVPADPALAVYWRTSRHAQRSALIQAYPVLHALLGADRFETVAAACLDQHPQGPCPGDLHQLGASLATCVASDPGCAAWPWLPDVARLEWALHRQFFAADAVDGVDPATLAPDDLARLALALAPAAVLLQLEHAILPVWQAHQSGAQALPDGWAASRQPAHLVLGRTADAQHVLPLLPDQAALLAASQAGQSLDHALQALVTPPDGATLAAWLGAWQHAGVLAGFRLV